MSILRAKMTDRCGNVKTLSTGPGEKVQWVNLKTERGVDLCISSAVCGLSDDGTAGQRQRVRAACKAAKDSADLARRLSVFGFNWKAA